MGSLNIISLEQFHELYPKSHEIATGTFGMVYSVRGKLIVVKTGQILDLLKDIDILSQISHPNIISITALAFDTDASLAYIAFPQGEDLLLYLKDNKSMYHQFMYELVHAVAFLHSRGIAHCDIKTNNIVVINNHPILIDLGSANICIPTSNTVSDKIDYMFISEAAFTIPFNPPEYKLDISSIRGDVFSLGKTFECLYLQRKFYCPNIPLIVEDDELLTLLFKDMLSDISIRPHARDLLDHTFFVDNHNNLNITQETGQCLTTVVPMKEPELLDITPKMYYIVIDWILRVLAINKVITTRDIFLIFHNIHRSINVMKSYKRKDFQLFGIVNIALTIRSINDSATFSLEMLLETLTKNIYTYKQFMDMSEAVIRQLGGIIYTPTYWDYCKSIDNLGNLLKQTLHWNYPYNPYCEDETVVSDASTSKLANGRDFIKNWMLVNNITSDVNTTKNYIEADIACKTVTTKMVMVPITVPVTSVTELKIRLGNELIIKVESNFYRQTEIKPNLGTNVALGLIWALRSEMTVNSTLANKILHTLVNPDKKSTFYKVLDQPGLVYMYDIIFGTDKLEKLKGKSVKYLEINTYTATLDDILADMSKELPIKVL